MLKKTITYQDLDGNDVTEDFYFGLSQPELAKMQLGTVGGFDKQLQEMITSRDKDAIMKAFDQVIRQSIGQRSEDGKRFIKSEQISDEFMQTDAYSQLFMSIATDLQAGVDFIRGVVPSALKDKLEEAMKAGNEELTELVGSKVEFDVPEMPKGPVVIITDKFAAEEEVEAPKKFEEYNLLELHEMPQHQFDALVGTDPGRMTRQQLVVAMQRRVSQK